MIFANELLSITNFCHIVEYKVKDPTELSEILMDRVVEWISTQTHGSVEKRRTCESNTPQHLCLPSSCTFTHNGLVVDNCPVFTPCREGMVTCRGSGANDHSIPTVTGS